jgi:hypothetical protein
MASLLVMLPALFLTTTLNLALLSPWVAGGVVYDERVAPAICALFFFHW